MDIYHQQQDHQLYNYHNPANPSTHSSMINQFPLLQQVQQSFSSGSPPPQQQQPQPQAQPQQQQQQQMSYMYHDINSYPLLSQSQQQLPPQPQQQQQPPPYQLMQQYQLSNQLQLLFPQWNSKFVAAGNVSAPQEIPVPPQFQQLAMSIQQQVYDDSYMNRSHQQQQQQQQQGPAATKRSLGNVSPHSQRVSLSLSQQQVQQPDDHSQMPTYNNTVSVSSPNSARSLTYPIYGTQPMIPSNGLQFQSLDQQNLPPLRNSLNSVISSGLMSAPSAMELGLAAITPSQLSSVSSVSSSSSTGNLHSHHHHHGHHSKHGSMSKKREKKRRNTIDGMSIETAARNRCPTCQKQFKRPSSLKTHMYSHTGEKPFVCLWDGCEKIFSVRSNMIRHLRLHEKRIMKGVNGKESHFQFENSSQSPNDDEGEEDEHDAMMQLNSVENIDELKKTKY